MLLRKNSFCSYFSSIASSLKQASKPLCNFAWKFISSTVLRPSVTNSFTFQRITENEVLVELKKLKRTKRVGMDSLPLGMLKDASSTIVKPLTYSINVSLTTGLVPTDWKDAKLIPLHKSGNARSLDSYRPISILPSVSKILEKFVHRQLMDFFERNNLLSIYQCGFQRNKLTELTGIYLTDRLRPRN